MGEFVKCNCQHCGGHIEFEREQLSPEISDVPCPHCGQNTFLYVPNSNPAAPPPIPPPLPAALQEHDVTDDREANGYQKTILRSLDIFQEKHLRTLTGRQAEEMVAAARIYKELLRSLRESGVLRQRISTPVQECLFNFTLTNRPSETSFLTYIREQFPDLLLSGSYAKAKSRRNQQEREIRQTGEFAPPIYIDRLPPRQSDDPDATPAQKRFLRDLGVRDESMLEGLGKSTATALIEKVLDERRKHGIP